MPIDLVLTMFSSPSRPTRTLQALAASITLHAVAAYALITAPQHHVSAPHGAPQTTITAHLLAPAVPLQAQNPVVIVTQDATAPTQAALIAAAHPAIAGQVGIPDAPARIAVTFMPALRLESTADTTNAPSAEQCGTQGATFSHLSVCKPIN